MPENMSQEDGAMSAKITVAREKAVSLKKGLTREKNGRAARKREYLAQTLQPPHELVSFLQSNSTWRRIEEMAERNLRDILVRRYVDSFQLKHTN